MIHPDTRARAPELAERWRETGSMRIEPFLEPAVADELLASLRGLPHVIREPSQPGLRFLFYELAIVPEEGCDHITCRLGRWLFGDGCAWLRDVTGLVLKPPRDRRLVATAYGKGCYLEPHNDVDGNRVLAYVIGLSPATWPARDGGHLEFVEPGDGPGALTVCERRAPGWNTLDIFDVRKPGRTHRVPILTRARERRAFSGWFYRR